MKPTSLRSLLEKFRSLETGDFRILLAVEAGMAKHEFVPLPTIIEYSNLIKDDAVKRIPPMQRLRLLRRCTTPYEGYSLNYAGYDFLALNVFTKGGVLQALGQPLGIGKEADVYDAISPTEETVAVKFHRLGRISFRQTARLRPHDPAGIWLFRSRNAAEKEFQALKRLSKLDFPAPKPIHQNRHALVMSKIIGIRAVECGVIEQPRRMLIEILHALRKAYLEAGLVHGDLSEFNVLMEPKGFFLIIDWPQWVGQTHPNVEAYLQRDVDHIVKFFNRKYKVRMDTHLAEGFVKGQSADIA